MVYQLTSRLAHIGSNAEITTTTVVVASAVAVLVGLLVLEHLYVKHGGLSLRIVAKPLAALVVVAVGGVIAPPVGFAQSTIGAMGLPDLISDPPFIWIERDLYGADDNVIHVLAFDGILHNIGSGALEVAGNPQIEGGVTQRVFDGETWSDVATPDVRFETDDGHNHFHLMNAARYSLWNDARTEEIEVGMKVGFCLLDTMQIERGVDAEYLIDEINYCNTDEPDSTDLRMGISPGWVDIYEASVTFQWVDVSNTAPGRYYVGAEIDPDNQIVESNEDNNTVVFSSNAYDISGYVARPLPVQTESDIVLKSRVYGTVGQVAYVIVDEPEHGVLSVPAGYDVVNPAITYYPEDGYEGPDSFSYYAHDVNSGFPFDAEIVTVDIDVTSAMPSTTTSTAPDFGLQAESSEISASRYERISLPVTLTGSAPDAVFYAQGLPHGLMIDPTTGVISGEITMPGDTTSTIAAMSGDVVETTTIAWSVEDRPRVTLRALNDFSTTMERRDILAGAGSAATTYEGTGLPPGVTLSEGQPSLLGVPEEAGEFPIVVNELQDGEVVDTVRFTMTVRPSTHPEFPL